LTPFVALFAGVCTDFEAELVEFDGKDDHVHLLVNYPPKVVVSNFEQALRKNAGVVHCGRLATLPEAMVAHRLR
jgi:REP element-mobilizing transposase RayT